MGDFIYKQEFGRLGEPPIAPEVTEETIHFMFKELAENIFKKSKVKVNTICFDWEECPMRGDAHAEITNTAVSSERGK
jgi:hypothetical protein